MNERIKELREQAFDWVQYQLQTVGSDHPVMQNEQLQMVNEKFAELIVRECIELRKDVPLKGLPSEEYEEGFWEGLRQYESMIEEHFGVEE